MFPANKNFFFIIVFFSLFISCIYDKNPLKNIPTKTSTLIVKDYQYIRINYFFLDIYYSNYFNKGIEKENPMVWIYEPQNKIVSLDLFKSSSNPSTDVIKGIASVNPIQYKGLHSSKFDSIEAHSGEVEKGYLKHLKEGEDYWVDYYRGFIGLKNSISNANFLSVSYITNSDTVGTPISLITIDTTILLNTRLLKSVNVKPSHSQVWPLMMKNIYHFEPPNKGDEFEITISTYYNGENIFNLFEGKNQSFRNLLGLDILDLDGRYIELGDDKLDTNPQLIDLTRGILIFPCLQPFSPTPSSHFKIPEQYCADIYSSLDLFDMCDSSKFTLKFITTRYGID